MKIFVCADDLTGASDSAVQFTKNGLNSTVVLYSEKLNLPTNSVVAVCDCESRDIDVQEAFTRVYSAVAKAKKNFENPLLYKKTDSTLRGHIGAELEAAMSAGECSFAIFSPSYIKTGRTAEHGIMFLKGIPIAQTELANIPKSPITKSAITEIIAQECSLKSAVLDVEILNKGLDSCIKAIEDMLKEGIKIVICDATCEEHLHIAAQCANYFAKSRPLLAGSAGLAEYIRLESKHEEDLEAYRKKSISNVLVLAGSISETTRRQVHALAQLDNCFLFKTSPSAVVSEPVATAIADARKIVMLAKDKHIVIVSAAYESADVKESAETALSLGISFFEAGERTAIYMATLVKHLSMFDAFVMTGGDTAVHACMALQATSFKILREIESGIPLSEIADGEIQGKLLVTKAGAFGSDQAFVKAVDLLLGK